MYDKLSTKQKIVLDKKGKFVVRACPGSGKTYCVSAKLSRLVAEWYLPHQGIATISFTNTAWQEIGKRCEEDFKTKIIYPHFLGTIDSFINQYIFLPFGHLVLGCNKRPIMVGEPYGIWGGGINNQDPNYYFDKVSYNIKGEICGGLGLYFLAGFPPQFTKSGTENKNYTKLKNMKASLLKKGYATQADANYFSMVLLEKYPIIRKTLAFKFPWIIVDEAQDTTEIQMKIIDLITSENKNQHVMLVGDPDQAIFEWNNAKPELFTEKYKLWEKNSVVFDESWRSSKKICDVVHKLSSLDKDKIIAVKEIIKDFNCQPEVCVYEEGKRREIIKKFIEKCEKHSIEITPKTTVVLARSKGFFVSKYPPNIIPWINTCPYLRDFAIGKFLIEKKDFARGIKYIEKGYIKYVKNIYYCSEKEFKDFIDEKGYIEFSKEIKNIIALLPETDTSLGVWVDIASKNFKSKNININFIYNKEAKDFPFSALFPQEFTDNTKLPYRLSTIHKVKGETFDAVLLFLKKRVSKKYKTMLESYTISNEEELRNVYVAISRPRKVLMIAVPDEEDRKCWAEKLGL